MKRLLVAIISGIIVVSLSGCASNKSVENNKESKPDMKVEEQKKDEKEQKVSQEDLNEQLKKEAVKADFVELNGNTDKNKNLKVFAEGTISVVDYDRVMDIFPSFTLTQEEGEGYGIYHISNVLSVEGLKDGDKVKVYGVVDGENDSGLIKISATVIEK
ncbi:MULTISPECIES: hypothetical protein [Clostridium]|jgi:colicin import membrane protein|uniref:hypothetical protein n=1 Tax=Clostridium TaxID=1485 RepID=UPI000C07FDE4|nr:MULTISPECIES: hypothetical protein [Clostridium]MBS4958920.1 hypothetical protein [Clostridium sp.]MBU6135992.1 OB-fold putative lipoprotein [Clostridium tertium]MDU7243284.1 hypothetical protein [Clostridium sp.]MDY4607030.1 hypothetical protein [Clostridium tertium]